MAAMIPISPGQSLAVFVFMLIAWLSFVWCLTRPITDADLKKDFTSRQRLNLGERPEQKTRNNKPSSGECLS